MRPQAQVDLQVLEIASHLNRDGPFGPTDFECLLDTRCSPSLKYANNVVGKTLSGGSAVAGQEKGRQQINGSVEQRRKEIVAAAGRLFMKKGYQATSMRELARTLQLDVASLYRYRSEERRVGKECRL